MIIGQIDHRHISIHALREEGDRWHPERQQRLLYFYPRPPRGGRPRNSTKGAQMVAISIHALREEGDGTPCAP